MIRIALIVEDGNFRDFLGPAALRIAEISRRPLEIAEADLTQGCRPAVLTDRFRRFRDTTDLIVIGADATGPGHRGKARTYRQKVRALMQLLGIGEEDRACFAVAEPCIEAWLLSDARAFAAGIGEGLDCRLDLPPTWRGPTTDQAAKAMLGRVLMEGAGVTLGRRGFEFATEIVKRMDLVRSSSVSLAAWARDMQRRILTL